MPKILLTGSSSTAPKEVINNHELVASFNQYVKSFNHEHAKEIEQGKLEALKESTEEFILNASGIKNRHVIDKKGILDPAAMQPIIPERSDNTVSLQAEMAIEAAKIALDRANKKPEEVDVVLLSCSNFQRAYPAVSIEVQAALGCKGYAYDMNVACSSATFGLQAAANALIAKAGTVALVVNPEITSAHLNFKDRDSHFIFGDACTAVVLETEKTCHTNNVFEILGTKLSTQFSSNVRNNFGFLNRTWPPTCHAADKFFKQNGRQVFKEITPMAAKFILEHLAEHQLAPQDIRRFWLHQANLKMNQLIMQRILGEEASEDQAPIILDEYANTASAGSLICFAQYHEDFKKGEIGLLSSFGAGYSIGSILLKKV